MKIDVKGKIYFFDRKANSPDVTPTKNENIDDNAKAGCSKDDGAAEPNSQGSGCSSTQEMMDNSEPLFEYVSI